MVYTLRFFSFSKCSLFHNSNVFGSCIIHILYTGCAKIKKNSGAKRLRAPNVILTGRVFGEFCFKGDEISESMNKKEILNKTDDV